ncbi:MAG: hypothetical protein A2Z97_04325 [Bdellovibrionales bacterium GWB1_52_6]|nr:MAG: hypothetical protein A2Z97_04325 [Bdellovibrionales bacterium GWB1_52_6]
METMRLSSFYRNVSTLPKSEAELAAAASRAAQVCGAQFAAIQLSVPGQPELLAVGTFEPDLVPETAEAALKEFLRTQISLLDPSPKAGDLRTFPVGERNFPFWRLRAPRSITIIPISIQSWLNGRGAEAKIKQEAGWLALGGDHEQDVRQGILGLALAQRFSELGEIAQLESIIAQRGQFLSIASHDLKTPLTAIYGILQLQERVLRQKKDEPEGEQIARQQSFLKMVIRQVERLNELIDGLLNVSRIQNGRFVVEPSEVDVASILKESSSQRMNIIAAEAGVSLKLESPPILTAWVDPVRFEELVTNLIMNGIRFSPEGGSVWVKLAESSGAFRLSVRDQGPAVPLEDRERIFHPFERAQRTARMGGMGLGLFISKQIAQLHGGNVMLVESIPGKGNVFEAYFPIKTVTSLSA